MHAFIDPFLLMNWGFDQRLPDPVSLKMDCSFNCGVKINPSLLNPSFITAFVKVFYFSNRKKMKTMSLNFCSSCPFIPSARIPGVYQPRTALCRTQDFVQAGQTYYQMYYISSPNFWPHCASSLRNNTGTRKQGSYGHARDDEVLGIQKHTKWLNSLMLLQRLQIRGKGGFWYAWFFSF